MPVKYKDKIAVADGSLIYTGKDAKEKIWAEDIKISVGIPVPNKWKAYISSIEDGVPIPKGFTYKEGTKATGVVIEDGSHNEFVWIPVDGTNIKYEKFTTFSGTTPTGDDALPTGVTNEEADVNMYHGFYIGRYEATIPDNATSPTDSTGIPTCKSKRTVWTNISYNNAKPNAESMYTGKNTSVQSGLLTGTAWDTTCKWIENEITKINESSTLNDSRFYGNYKNSQSPANSGKGSKHEAGYNENWKTKNIYDLAGNVWEWTYEAFSSGRIGRGGSCSYDGDSYPVSYRYNYLPSYTHDRIGFHLRLYIKTN